jgi:uncharacterized protein YndB with AHSA1/START domain
MRFDIPIEIKATPERVWSVLMDVERWPQWSSTFKEIRVKTPGDFGLGSVARIKQPKQFPATWIVTQFEPNKSFAWTSKQGGLTLFADHQITPHDDGVTVVLTAILSGPLGPVIGALQGGRVRRAVTTEAHGLKNRSEGTA